MTECPPGVHSIFDPCPGNCTENVSAREELYEVLSGHRGERFATSLINEFAHEIAEEIRAQKLEAPEGFVYRESWIDAWNEGRDTSADLIDPEVEI
ncbi:hypothetical protein ACFWNC_14665 [Streptomyces sp. NPDC058369]|uniref:hypothetical protein n=1 Tax=Streptomyces sp. NPDC058369 TaxID=3346462 RepID=UPI00364CEF10